MRQLLTELFTCKIARKELLECDLRDLSIDYFCVHQYTFTYEVRILNLWSYHSLARAYHGLKRDEEVLKDICDILHTVTMSTRQAIEKMIEES